MPASVTFSLPDIVLVSGAASGLGLELCTLLLALGVDTVGVDLQDVPPEVAREGRYRHVAGDVAAEATWG